VQADQNPLIPLSPRPSHSDDLLENHSDNSENERFADDPQGKGNSQWAPVRPRTRDENQPTNLLSPRSREPVVIGDLQKLEIHLDSSDNDDSADALPRGKEDQYSHLLETDKPSSITPLDSSAKKTKLSKLARLISPRNKTRSGKKPIISPRTKPIKMHTEGPSFPKEKPGVVPSSNELVEDPIIGLDFDLIKMDESPAAPKGAIQVVTMDNLLEVIDKRAYEDDGTLIMPDRRITNLIYCAAGGRDVINQPTSCPETGAFAQSLMDLPKGERERCVNDLVRKFGRHMTQKQWNSLNGEKVESVLAICRYQLGDEVL